MFRCANLARLFVLFAVSAAIAIPLAAGPAKTSAASSEGQVVARVGDKAITMKELDEMGLAASLKTYQALYDVRRQVMDQMIGDYLIEKEAKARGVTTDALIKAEITDKISPVTDQDIESWYNANKARVRNQPLESLKPRIQGFLATQRAAEARTAFVDTLKAKTHVDIKLDPPRIPVSVAKDDPSIGPVNAPVQIVEFSDYQCPYSHRALPNLQKLSKAYGNKVRHVYKNFPLNFHNQAHRAAEAALCAKDQNKFWEYHDKLFANQRELSEDNLKKFAADLGLDTEKFNACLDANTYKARVDEDLQEGMNAGVSGTPAVFINGRFVAGAVPYEQLKQIVDDELALKGVSPPK